MSIEAISWQQSRWGSLRGFARSVATHAGYSGLTTAALVAGAALLDGAGLLLLAPLLGVITGGAGGWIQRTADRLFAAIGVTDRLAELALLLSIFLLLATARALVSWRRDVALANLQTGFAEGERNRLIAALAGAPWTRLLTLRHAETTALLSTEVQRLAGACSYLIQGTVQFVLLGVQTVVALLLAPALAAAVLAMLVIATLVFAGRQRRIHIWGEEVVKASVAMMASAAALLGGLKSAVAQNAQHAFVAEFAATQSALRQNQLAFAERQARGRSIYAIVSAVLAAGLIAIGFGIFKVPAAILLTLVLVFARMSSPAQQLYQSAQMLMFTIPAFEAVRRAERALTPGAGEATAAIVPPPHGAIALSGVTYLHSGGGGVQDVNLVVPPGLFLGIGGPSGSGKTTLADLIVGLLEPQSGLITVGGDRLDGPLRRAWGDCIAYVTQDGFLFDDSVRRNLLWGVAPKSDAEIAASLALVGADSLVGRLDQGLDTIVGERGAVLSGGERQRLVLARALLREPRLLVLDEAANAIDAESETMLLERLKALDPRPAIIMISHRQESLDRCDSVVRVEDGAVIVQR